MWCMTPPRPSKCTGKAVVNAVAWLFDAIWINLGIGYAGQDFASRVEAAAARSGFQTSLHSLSLGVLGHVACCLGIDEVMTS